MLICRYWSSGFLHCCKLPVLTAKRSSKRSAQKDQCALHVLESGAGRAMELRAAYSRSSGGMQRVLPVEVEEGLQCAFVSFFVASKPKARRKEFAVLHGANLYRHQKRGSASLARRFAFAVNFERSKSRSQLFHSYCTFFTFMIDGCRLNR